MNYEQAEKLLLQQLQDNSLRYIQAVVHKMGETYPGPKINPDWEDVVEIFRKTCNKQGHLRQGPCAPSIRICECGCMGRIEKSVQGFWQNMISNDRYLFTVNKCSCGQCEGYSMMENLYWFNKAD